MLGSTFEEDDLSALKIAFQNCNNQRSLASSPLMHDMQPASSAIDDYMNCSDVDVSSIDNNHNIMASMIMSGQSQFDDLSSSIINSQNLSPFANNFLNGLCSSPQNDMLMDAASNSLLLYSSITSRCDSASSLLYLNGEKRSATSTVPDSSSGSICTSTAASSTDVDDALLKSIEEADGFFDHTHSPIIDVPITSCSILGNLNSGTSCSAPITSPVLSSPEDGVTLHSPMNDCMKFESKSLKKLPDLPPPPKKPLSPYMRFSKGIWQKVKAANPGMTVCEVGANIGRVWRELSDTDKQRFNDDFLNDKVRYDTELQKYLQVTGLQASDLVKPRTRKKDQKEKPSRKTSRQNSNLAKLDVVSQQLMQEVNNVADLTQQSPNEALTPVGLPSFSQVWSQPEFSGGQDTEVSCSVRGSCDGSTTFEDADDTEQLLNGISLQNSMFGHQNNFCGELQQSNMMQSINGTGSLLNKNTWMWQQLNTNEQEQQSINRDTVINSLQQQQFKKVSNLTSVNDFKNSNGIYSDLMQTNVDPEKLLLRSALVEKSQEVLKLMKELEQAYGLIHQLKQQNDFFQQHWTSMHSLQGSNELNNSVQQLPTVSASQQTDLSPK